MRTNSINAPAMPEGQQDESGLGRFWTWRHDSSLGGRFYDTRDMRVAGDMISGALLAQAIYWSDGRLRVQIDGELYIAKTHEEWASELEVVSSSQAKRAIERLANILVMDTDNKRRIRKPRPGESVLKPGDEVKLRLVPAKSGAPVGRASANLNNGWVVKADGTLVIGRTPEEQAEVIEAGRQD